MNTSLLYWALLIILGILFPIYSFLEGPKVKTYLSEKPKKLASVYRQIVVFQIFLILLLFLSFYFNNDSIDKIGLAFLSKPIAVIGLISISFFVLWLLARKSIPSEKIDSIKASYSEVIYLMPQNTEEYRWSVALSFVVGFCEEILYRGFLFWQLTLHMPLVVALILTNIIFGVLHFGTGIKNMVLTFFLGMFYSLISFPLGTLWFAVLAHVLTDLYSISIGYKIKNLER